MNTWLTIALSKGRLLPESIDLLNKAGISHSELLSSNRRLVFDIPGQKIRLLMVRAGDVPTYVEYGAADMGISGKNILLEDDRELFEPLDLKFGHCRIMLAEPMGSELTRRKNPAKLKIATKYPRITEKYFSQKGIPVELIKLGGSIELAPMMGLADQIVDLVSTGATLKAHHLRIVDEIASSTARLIVNRASLKLKYKRVYQFIDQIRGILS
ncbi:MAG: ATP phosphoribosyltransferase [Nitrospirae bacterium]|nr:ATP phosphoribosyltransferase [Nitrospirota bacterium]MBI3593885.1 ATP phosphoribosyltransferase [Nitrospirota bacterium]